LSISAEHSTSTVCHTIHQLLKSGFPRGQITLIYGTYKTGKTTFALQSAINNAKKKFKTLYVDSDDTFSTSRLSQITQKGLDTVSQLIILFKPRNFLEQGLLFEKLSGCVSDSVALIVVDTITSLYRISLQGPEETFAFNRELNRQLALLTELAVKNDVAVLLTGQVHSIIDERFAESEIEPVATRVLTFWSHNILRLTTTKQRSIRIATIEKFAKKESKDEPCLFVLTEKGVSHILKE
jgi:RecA/RadA recombinase